jgi:hypothetical protein
VQVTAGAEAMQKSQDMWQDAVAQVKAAATARQEQLRGDNLRNLRIWQTKKSERQASGGKRGKAEKKPGLQRIKRKKENRGPRLTPEGLLLNGTFQVNIAGTFSSRRSQSIRPSPNDTSSARARQLCQQHTSIIEVVYLSRSDAHHSTA